jgi:hypothetical protein
VFLSTNEGIALLGSNCPPAFYGPGTGGTFLSCLPNPPPSGDQSVQSARYRSTAIRYVRHHLGRYPVVLLARAGRDWSLFRPLDMLNNGEGRPRWVTGLGLVFYYPLLILAISGAVVLRRYRQLLWPLVVPPIVITIGVVFSYGWTRFRVPAEPSLVVLASVGIASAIHELRTRSIRRSERQVGGTDRGEAHSIHPSSSGLGSSR